MADFHWNILKYLPMKSCNACFFCWYSSGSGSPLRPLRIPTVSLGVTSAVVCTYGYDDGRIAPTRCAVIDAALGDRCRQCRACRTLPAAAGSAHSKLAAGSRPVSTVDPGGFHRSRTISPSATRPCGDANPARCAPGTRPSPPRPCHIFSVY